MEFKLKKELLQVALTATLGIVVLFMICYFTIMG